MTKHGRRSPRLASRVDGPTTATVQIALEVLPERSPATSARTLICASEWANTSSTRGSEQDRTALCQFAVETGS